MQEGFFPAPESKEVVSTKSQCRVSTRPFLLWVLDVSETCELCSCVLCFLVTMFVHANIVCLHMLQLCCLVKQRDSPIRPLQHRLFKLRGQEGDFDPLGTTVSSSLAQQEKCTTKFSFSVQEGLGCSVPWDCLANTAAQTVLG